MSHSVTLPDDIYEQVEALAERQGQPVEVVIRQALARVIRQSSHVGALAPSKLDWATASAEEILAELRASRVEREHDIEL